MRTLAFLAVLAVAGCGGAKSEGAEPVPAPGPGPAPDPGPVSGGGPAPGAGGRCAGNAPGPGYVCLQDCGGPVVREGDPPPGWSWHSPAEAESRRNYGCPVCLPETARIATPRGDAVVSALRPGDPIWSSDCEGRRLAARVQWIRSVPVAPGHRLVRAELSDGRTVLASPLHPLTGGAAVETLRRGDALDGAWVERAELVPYAGERTWDVLPSGPTGAYWADGVPLGSTLGTATGAGCAP